MTEQACTGAVQGGEECLELSLLLEPARIAIQRDRCISALNTKVNHRNVYKKKGRRRWKAFQVGSNHAQGKPVEESGRSLSSALTGIGNKVEPGVLGRVASEKGIGIGRASPKAHCALQGDSQQAVGAWQISVRGWHRGGCGAAGDDASQCQRDECRAA